MTVVSIVANDKVAVVQQVRVQEVADANGHTSAIPADVRDTT